MTDDVAARPPLRCVIERLADDPLCDRVSIGGGPKIGGYYLEFRGDPAEVLNMLRTVTRTAEKALPEGHYADKRGRPQG